MAKWFKTDSGITILCGLAIAAWAIAHSIFDYFYRVKTGAAFDVGVMYGVGAHGVAGGLAVLIGLGLRNIEKRLDRIENDAQKK